MGKQSHQNTAMRVSLISIAVNVALTVFKLMAGILAHSSAMISDAVHTASDVLSTFVVMLGIHAADKKADKNHPYGHERFECVAAIVLSVMLLLTGMGIGYDGFQKVWRGLEGGLATPGLLALIAAVVSIVVKEWMFWYTRAAAKKINSGALMADAWHHRSDALSSIGSFAGILGARLGFPILDPVASLIICIFIVKAAIQIFIDAINKMSDQSCDDQVVEQMSAFILSQEGVHSLDSIKTRLFGSKIYVDVEIGVNKELTFEKAHEIAEAVHGAIEARFEHVKHCMVHANPSDIE